jgi:hypothetical protein
MTKSYPPNPTMLEDCEKHVRVFQGEQSEDGAAQTQQGPTGESDLQTIRMKCHSIFGGALQPGLMSIAPLEGMLQHHKPAGQAQINDCTTTSTSERAIEPSKESHQLPAKETVGDVVLDETEFRCDILGSTIFENSHAALAKIYGVPPSPKANHTGGAFGKDLTPMDLLDRCMTGVRTRGDCFQLCIGCDNMIQRWLPGPELPFYVDASSFPTKEDANHAAIAMVTAATRWNMLGGNVPCFKKVDTISAAVFQLKYAARSDSKNGETAFARAFFPGDVPLTVYVYALSFKPLYRNYLANIFCHELGHILGARHSFAPEREHKVPCKILGERNPDTVMQYPDHPKKLTIQDSDAREMKTFYDLKDTHYLGCLIEDYLPQKLIQLSQHAKQPAETGEETGTKLATTQKVNLSDSVARNLKMNALTRAVLIVGSFTMGLWVGSWAREHFCSACKEVLRHLYIVL